MQKLIIALVMFGSFYGLYLYGTRNSEVTLSEWVEETPEESMMAGVAASASSTSE